MACGDKAGVGCAGACCGALPAVDALGLAGLGDPWDGFPCGPGDTWSRGADCVEQAFCVEAGLTYEECQQLQACHSRGSQVRGQPYKAINAKRMQEAGARKRAGGSVLPPDCGGTGGSSAGGESGSVFASSGAGGGGGVEGLVRQYGVYVAGGLAVILVGSLLFRGK